MTGRMRRRVGWVFGIALILAGCSGGDSEGGTADDTVGPSDSAATSSDDGGAADAGDSDAAASTPTTLPRATEIEFLIDPDTGELTEVEVEAPGPATFIEVVDFGVEAGLWDEVEGLTRVLGYAVGAVPAEQVPGADEVLTGELNGLLRRANVLALNGEYTDEELADLKRWYELAVPSDDLIARLVASAGGDVESNGDPTDDHIAVQSGERFVKLANSAAGGQGLPRLLVAQVQANCVPVDPNDFDDSAVIKGCYEMFEDVFEGVRLRVLYPTWYLDDPTLANLPLLAREALAKSVSTYSSLGEIGDMSLVFSPVATDSNSWATVTNHSQWASSTTPAGCPITVFPAEFRSDGQFQTVVAHEVWHCVQGYSGYPTSFASGVDWYEEGGATYFSNVVYPKVNDEHGWVGTFDRDSRANPLFSMEYEAWIWWQFLANRESPQAVADLHLQMAQAGDGGKGAMTGYGPIFQRFVIEFVAGSINDAGSKIRPARKFSEPPKKVTKNDTSKVIEFEVEPFVAGRFLIEYEKELRVFQSDQTSTNGEVAMVETKAIANPDNWRKVYPEVRSECKNKTSYVVVATTQQGSHTAKVQIGRIEEASCDPCVLGTWELDLDTFATMISSAMAAEGASLPSGTSIEFSGHYYTSFDDKGVMREQRDGLIMTIGSPEGTFGFTVDSFAEGKYEADGERLTVFDAVELYSEVTTGVPGFGSTFTQGSSIMEGGAGDYECRTDDMTLTIDGFEQTRSVRVDKILKPPPTDAP